MTSGRINDILEDKKKLEDEPWENIQIDEIPDLQKEKTVEILTYIKRQKVMQSQKNSYDEQIKLTKEQRDVVDQLEIQNEEFSSDSEFSDGDEKSTFEEYLIYFQNSSLFIFNQ